MSKRQPRSEMGLRSQVKVDSNPQPISLKKLINQMMIMMMMRMMRRRILAENKQMRNKKVSVRA